MRLGEILMVRKTSPVKSGGPQGLADLAGLCADATGPASKAVSP
jgi:hypothetical protein